MPRIEVQIIPTKGPPRVVAFDKGVVAYGREAGNDILLADPAASRRHGELRWQEGRWVLVNHSPNGTNVGGTTIERKPFALAAGQTIAIGDTPAFRIIAIDTPNESDKSESGHEPTGADATQDTAPTADAAKRRTRLWTWLILFWLIIIGLGVALSIYVEKPASQVAGERELTRAEIDADVRRPLKVPSRDDGKANEQLKAAAERVGKIDAAPGNLHETVRAFKLALAYRGDDRFEAGTLDLQYREALDALSERVAREYAEAYDALRSQQFRRADDMFRRLNQVTYPDPNSAVFRNAEKQRKVAAERLKAARG